MTAGTVYVKHDHYGGHCPLLTICKSAPEVQIPFYSIPFSTSTISIRLILRENRKLTSTDTVMTNIAAMIYVDGAI